MMPFVFFDFLGVLKIIPTIQTAASSSHKALYPGMQEIIAKLNKTHDLCIVSHSDTTTIMQHLDTWGISNYFTTIYGSTSIGAKHDIIQSVCKERSCDTQKSYFITDSLNDLQDVKNIPIQTIAVTWGLDSKASLDEASPNFIIDSPKELANIFHLT